MNYYFIKSDYNDMFFYFNDNKDMSFIPVDEKNTDYQQYLAWLEAGNTPEEWNPNGNN